MFKIGEPVVCVKSHSKNLIKEGEVFNLKGLHTSSCCGTVVLDVGIFSESRKYVCACGRVNFKPIGYGYFFHNSLLQPLDNLYNKEIEELTEEVNQELLVADV